MREFFEEIRSRGGLIVFPVLALIFLLLLLTQREPINPDVTGSYESVCCGSFDVVAGEILIAGDAVPYVLGRDKFGLYALPERAVLVAKNSVVVSNRPRAFLRFDDDVSPSSITIPKENQTGSVEFRIRFPSKFE